MEFAGRSKTSMEIGVRSKTSMDILGESPCQSQASGWWVGWPKHQDNGRQWWISLPGGPLVAQILVLQYSWQFFLCVFLVEFLEAEAQAFMVILRDKELKVPKPAAW